MSSCINASAFTKYIYVKNVFYTYNTFLFHINLYFFVYFGLFIRALLVSFFSDNMDI